MNDIQTTSDLLSYPIGSDESEGYVLETLKSLIIYQATRLTYGCGSEYILKVFINAYRIYKESEEDK